MIFKLNVEGIARYCYERELRVQLLEIDQRVPVSSNETQMDVIVQEITLNCQI